MNRILVLGKVWLAEVMWQRKRPDHTKELERPMKYHQGLIPLSTALLLLGGTMAPAQEQVTAPVTASSKQERNRQLLEEEIREISSAPESGARYMAGYIDLNGDKVEEVVVYLIGPEVCGSGGCPTLVFSPDDYGYRLVTYIEVTRPPIRVAKSKTKGWRDLIVFVSGGGILDGYNVLLPFDGSSYPESPFLDPARRLKGKARGESLIERTRYEDARPFASSGNTHGSALNSGTQAADPATKSRIEELIQREILLEEAHLWRSAIDVSKDILKLDPKSAAAMNTIAGLHGILGETQDEITWALKALEVDPGFYLAYINYGNGLALLGRNNEAQAAFRKAAELAPEKPLPIYSLGVMAENQGKFEEALSYYKQSVILDAQFENGYFNMAAALANLKRFDEAIATLKKLLDMNPDAQDAKQMLQEIEHERAGQPQE